MPVGDQVSVGQVVPAGGPSVASFAAPVALWDVGALPTIPVSDVAVVVVSVVISVIVAVVVAVVSVVVVVAIGVVIVVAVVVVVVVFILIVAILTGNKHEFVVVLVLTFLFRVVDSALVVHGVLHVLDGQVVFLLHHDVCQCA